MDKKIRWGVIGSGGIARRRTIPEGIVAAGNAELVSVYDINAKANVEVAKQFDASAVGSIDELLASDIQAVYIATPANMHYEQVLACAKAKKHILCEKPLGMTVKETQKMIEVCKKAKVQLGTAFMMRFLAQHQAAEQMIKDGKLGKPVYGRAQLSCWYPPMKGAWRQDPRQGGGGSLMDMGGHCIDLLEMFFGPVKAVSCFIRNSVHKYKSEDSAVAMLEFRNGAIGTVDTFFCIPDNSSKNILELYGSNGSIIAKGTIGQGNAGEMTAYLEGDAKGYDAQQTRASDKALEIKPTPINTYKAEIEEFSVAILKKRKPANNAAVGLQSQKVLAACYKSARTGKTIKI
ncbi:MAG: Gfo/Idh/MocA family oxidoreductase [Phycisphaerae bacterium]|jgi:predicted dehydrogenase